jgi:hypothetical protein
MDVIIVTKLRTNAPNINVVADAITKAINGVLDNANLLAQSNKEKINTILSFELSETRPGGTVTKEFVFPNGLDDLEKQLNSTP